MIIVTGAAGFIGSCLCSTLIRRGYNVVGVDDFSIKSKENNFDKDVIKRVEREVFFEWLDNNHTKIDFIFHLGARTDTTEFDWEVLERLNLLFSKQLWNKCSLYKIALLYASSAATYGDGNLGYEDNESMLDKLLPLNPYGESKSKFDVWAIEQKIKPPFWIGLKFFNVYGPNEYHKGRMASVVYHAYNQIIANKQIKLFKSHNKDYRDGEQLRDFIYVKDVISICLFFHDKCESKISGIYNTGTGKARTFYDLAKAVFKSLNMEDNIEFIEMPKDIRDKYQYYTQATTEKLRKVGFLQEFMTLEEGVSDYVKSYLSENKFY